MPGKRTYTKGKAAWHILERTQDCLITVIKTNTKQFTFHLPTQAANHHNTSKKWGYRQRGKMFILQDFSFISSAFVSKSSADCIYDREKLGKQPRYFENRAAPGNKVREKQGRDFEAWLGH